MTRKEAALSRSGRKAGAALLLLCGTFGCRGGAEPSFQSPPLPPGAVEPELKGEPNGLLLSWIEEHSLRYARLNGRRWTEPRTVVRDERLRANWAHLPALATLEDGSMVGSWPTGRDDAERAVDFAFSFSADGENWSAPQRPEARHGVAQRGWVELIDEGATRVGLISLEGGDGATRLVYRSWSDGGFGDARELDAQVCPWCRPSVARVGGDLLVAYRDHTDAQVRDIAYVRRSGGAWLPPETVHDDGWHIAGSPVNGPALVARGERAAVSWFTAAGGEPRVLLARWNGSGGFGEPLRIDSGEPLGRVDAAMLDDGTVYVSWLEKSADGARVQIRRVGGDGAPGEARILGDTAAGPEGGFPRMASANGRLYVAWVEPALARVRLASFRP